MSGLTDLRSTARQAAPGDLGGCQAEEEHHEDIVREEVETQGADERTVVEVRVELPGERLDQTSATTIPLMSRTENSRSMFRR
jgi:hypothetical protein